MTDTSQVGLGLYDDYAHFRDEKAANTGGGGFTLGAWRTRDLNTEAVSASWASLAANQFTLSKGEKYYVRARAPGYKVSAHKIKIRRITAVAADAIIGSSMVGAASTHGYNDAVLSGPLDLTAEATDIVFELQHQSSGTNSTDGFGVASNMAVVEVYTEIEIWRYAP